MSLRTTDWGADTPRLQRFWAAAVELQLAQYQDDPDVPALITKQHQAFRRLTLAQQRAWSLTDYQAVQRDARRAFDRFLQRHTCHQRSLRRLPY